MDATREVPAIDDEGTNAEATREVREDQLNTFISIYNGRRQKADMILIGALLGLSSLAVSNGQQFVVSRDASQQLRITVSPEKTLEAENQTRPRSSLAK